jgi:DUF4097 and DUF4098 domain-containing protein YvlB
MVSGISGRTRLNTVSGSVLADGTSGDLSVSTVSGEVIARNHHGVLTAKSVSGEVTASGDFSHIRANTVSGDLSFDLHGFTEDFGANSVSGDVTIRLPHDVGVDIIAKSASGAIVINDQRYNQPSGSVQTIAGPDSQLMLVRTNSVSGKTSIFHGRPGADPTKGP